MSVYCNEYGQHVLTTHNNTADYFLLGNDGIPVYSSHDLFPISAHFGAITGYGDVLYAAFDYGSSNQIRVYYSANGGQSWTASQIYTPNVTISDIDAFADAYGCHIVWDTEPTTDEVYYVHYSLANGLFEYQENVTEDNAGTVTGRYPKVLRVGDRLVVSFVTTNILNHNCGASRDADVSSGTPQWDYASRLTPSSVDFGNQSITAQGDHLYQLLFEKGGVGSEGIYLASRPLAGDWDALSNLDTYAGFEDQNFRRELVTDADTVYSVYCAVRTVPWEECLGWNKIGIRMRMHATNWTNWPVERIIREACADQIRLQDAAVSASRTGQYAFWSQGVEATKWMWRRVRSLSETIPENMFWTGNNWVSDDVTIESEKTVTAWAGSVTTVLANKKIIVAEGATLIVKDNAQFKFEPGASIDVQGSLIVQGTVQHPAIFTSTTPSGSWSGIDIGASATDCSIDYAHFSNASTAITVP